MSNPIPGVEQLVKSKQRISDHGEVFTPPHIVEAMLDMVKDESERIDSRFLEPACGEGAFLRRVLMRKLATVQSRYGKNEFERRHYALLGLMCIYGIELLEDNANLCRDNLVDIFTQFINAPDDTIWKSAARVVVEANIVQADALTMRFPNETHITFPEWGYLGKGRFQRRDFQYSDLTHRSSFVGTLFEGLDDGEIFRPKAEYKPMSVADLATGGKRCFS
ncbi:N-6 DNA methylase [Corynebacterium amycolatum]|uniref:N-6 DNA methylase n=1 Tax=Corynebacterium amycolatum TaxID=43765 RepID=UPI000C788F7B|nr:N-6 DNA methylase [Corynebacterium amycolatum]PLA34921.1 restriction endonuclease subunit M [Corynebacterium amycolatum]